MATKKTETGVSKEKTELSLPWWGRVLVGALGGFVLIKYTPLLECLTLCFYVCVVPLLFLASIGLVSDGVITGLSKGWRDTVAEINERVNAKIKQAA